MSLPMLLADAHPPEARPLGRTITRPLIRTFTSCLVMKFMASINSQSG